MSITAMPADGRAKGVGLVVASAILFASAGVFTKLIPSDAWTILFWRGLVAALCLFGFMAVRNTLRAEIRYMGWSGIAAAIVNSAGSIAFIPAFKQTTVANVTLIYTSAPFLAVFIAWIWLRERPSRRCLLAAAAALAGVAVIFGVPTADTTSGEFVSGNLLALWMTICMAGAMVIYRRYPETPVFGPIALSSAIVLLPGLVFSDPLSVPGAELPMLVGFGLCFALAAVGLMAGARLLPAAEAALLSLLETPLAPALAFVLLSETPSMRSLSGGVLIVLAMIWYLRGSTAENR